MKYGVDACFGPLQKVDLENYQNNLLLQSAASDKGQTVTRPDKTKYFP
jgi:ethanolamine ammonia-lyase small subunit